MSVENKDVFADEVNEAADIFMRQKFEVLIANISKSAGVPVRDLFELPVYVLAVLCYSFGQQEAEKEFEAYTSWLVTAGKSDTSDEQM